MSELVRTTCAYCGVGCGLMVEASHDGRSFVSGDPGHPSSLGKLCQKGACLGETTGPAGRYLWPEIAGKRASWEAALGVISEKMKKIVREDGPGAVAMYLSGQMLTEDYYVANKFMKGFLGSGHVDTNSRLCMSSAVAAQTIAFGEDCMPCCYEDIDRAELFVVLGSNMPACHPVLWQRLQAARQSRSQRQKLVVIDPRRGEAGESADLNLMIHSGTDRFLFYGLLRYTGEHGLEDKAYIRQFTSGWQDALDAVDSWSVEKVAGICGLSARQVLRFYSLFSGTDRVLTLYSQGVNQSESGTENILSVINVHLAAGKIGREGTGPFSLTGQNNAMGGRETGGLAGQLACHLSPSVAGDRQLLKEFWKAPFLPPAAGHKALDMFEAVGKKQIRCLWVIASNPLVSLPESDAVRRALESCELLIVSECFRSSATARLAGVLLPALTWGEKDGTVTNSERRISRQAAFMEPPGEAKADWWAVCEVAKRVCSPAAGFDFRGPADIFSEHATLSGFKNHGSRVFDISGLSGLSREEYRSLKPVQWPVREKSGAGTARLFTSGTFPGVGGRAFFSAARKEAVFRSAAPGDFILLTGRSRNHWHTMTRTERSPVLSSQTTGPVLAIHPDDALKLGLRDPGKDLVRVESQNGSLICRFKPDKGLKKQHVFLPFHWNSLSGKLTCVNTLTTGRRDPVSGQPAFKDTVVSVRRWVAAMQGFVVCRRLLPKSPPGYWVRSLGKACWRYDIFFEHGSDLWQEWFRSLGEEFPDTEQISSEDPSGRTYRVGFLSDNKLRCAVFLSAGSLPDGRSRQESLIRKDFLTRQDRLTLLSPDFPLI